MRAAGGHERSPRSGRRAVNRRMRPAGRRGSSGTTAGGVPWRCAVVALAIGATLSGCESTAPEDPLVRKATVAPSSDDGAAVVELVGAAVTSVTMPQGEGQAFFHSRGDTTRVVIVRTEPGAFAFDFRVANPSASPVGTVLQVADGENRLRDAGPYRVELSR